MPTSRPASEEDAGASGVCGDSPQMGGGAHLTQTSVPPHTEARLLGPAWLSFSRRLNRDYELLPESSETFIYTAMIRLMVRRLAS